MEKPEPPTRLELMIVILIVLTACVYFWPSKVAEKIQASNTQMSVMKVEEITPGGQKQEQKKIYSGIDSPEQKLAKLGYTGKSKIVPMAKNTEKQ